MRPTITKLSTVVVVLLVAVPLGAPAQQQGKLYRIGMLETIVASLNSANLQAFNQELKAIGYVEGQNLALDARSTAIRSSKVHGLGIYRSSSPPSSNWPST